MKQYDKIYVSCHGLESIGEIALNQGIENKCVYVKEVSNAIVLTIEEAEDIFKAGMARAQEIALITIQQQNGDPSSPNFKSYLHSKGITT